MNLATVGVLHVAMALEDPFDNQGLDGIYVDEALFEAEQVCIVGQACCTSGDRAQSPLHPRPSNLGPSCDWCNCGSLQLLSVVCSICCPKDWRSPVTALPLVYQG